VCNYQLLNVLSESGGFAPALVVGLNRHHHLHHLQKEGFEQGLAQNVVEDSFTQVHREEVESEFATMLLWLAKHACRLHLTAKLFCQW